MERFIEGSYSTMETAQLAVDSLVARGYDKADMTFVANPTAAQQLSDNRGVRVLTVDLAADEDNDGLWARFKNFFTRTDEAVELVRDDALLAQHRDQLLRGNILLLVESGLDKPLKDQIDDNPDLSLDPRDRDNRVIVPPGQNSPTSAAGGTVETGQGVFPPVVNLDDELDDDRTR